MANDRIVGVVGAGNMGSGIAQKLAQEGFTVVLHDMTEEFVQRGMGRIKTLLGEAVERKIFKPEQVEAVLARLQPTSDLADLAKCGMVIEAVFEDLQVKKDLFAKLSALCPDDTILASNTSSFYVADIALAATRPERVVGLHFFYHPAKNRLVEVIPGAATSPEVVARTMDIAVGMAKTPILCADRPGFVVNRFFVPWLNESVRLLGEGFDIATIEAAAKEAFGIGMGPFQLMNVTGVPIAWHAETTLGKELGSYYVCCDRLAEAGKANQQWDLAGEPDRSKFPAVAAHLRGVIFQVAGELLDEKVCSMENVDRGAKIGLRWAKGPFEMMNRLGVDKAVAEAEAFCKRFGHALSPTLAAKRAQGGPWAFQWVDISIDDGAATLTVNRPEAMNALNDAVVANLSEQFDRVAADPAVKGIVIAGAGKAFIAGADISIFVRNMKAGTYKNIEDFARVTQKLLRKMELCEKPVIALADGLTLGGGSELATACHAIVATEKSRFAFPETSIGIYPGLGGTQRPARIVGRALARCLVLSGTALSGKDAKDIGFAGYYVPSAEAAAFARELARKGGLPDKFAPKTVPPAWEALAKAFSGKGVAPAEGSDMNDEKVSRAFKAISRCAPLALEMAAKLIDEGLAGTLDAGLEGELTHMQAAFATADAMEGLTALGVRKPEYKGK